MVDFLQIELKQSRFKEKTRQLFLKEKENEKQLEIFNESESDSEEKKKENKIPRDEIKEKKNTE